LVGTSIGHYHITESLGKGGMGEVYAAEDTRLGRRVALKVLPRELAMDADRRERFEREAHAVAALNHPNIVTIYSVEEAGGVPFLTLELVEGRTLETVIPPGGLPVDRILAYAIPLADAVGAAHQRGITHRDLKPGNVMIRLLDGTRAYLHAVIDNFSRRVLGWRVADTFAPGSTVAVLLEATRGTTRTASTPVVVADAAWKRQRAGRRIDRHRRPPASIGLHRADVFELDDRELGRLGSPWRNRRRPSHERGRPLSDPVALCLSCLQIQWRELARGSPDCP